MTVLRQATESMPYVHALWIEGSGPQGYADEYSDIDLWLSVDDEKVFNIYEELESALATISPIDFKYVVKHEGNLGHTVYHLEGMSEFLTVDINTQGVSREVVLTKGIDDATIIFDKDNIIKFKERESRDIDIDIDIDIERKRQKVRAFYEQMLPSVKKNVLRKKPLEALYYYHLILKYTTKFLWLKYDVPEKKGFDLKHIYRTLPEQDTQMLEEFYNVAIQGIAATLPKLREWIYSL